MGENILQIQVSFPPLSSLPTWHTLTSLRTALAAAEISGPTLANLPSNSDTWWTNYLSFIASNGSIPDQYAWHMEGGGGDMQSSVSTLHTLQITYGLSTTKTININEYATYAEQVPQGGAWWIAQLERVNAYGLRGNWLSGTSLHDFMAGLLGKRGAGTSSYSATAAGYWPAPEFNVYKYYGTNMTGHRVQTLPTPDLHGDVYCTVGTDKVRMLVGARVTTGTWGIQLVCSRQFFLLLCGAFLCHRLEGSKSCANKSANRMVSSPLVCLLLGQLTFRHGAFTARPTTSLRRLRRRIWEFTDMLTQAARSHFRCFRLMPTQLTHLSSLSR